MAAFQGETQVVFWTGKKQMTITNKRNDGSQKTEKKQGRRNKKECRKKTRGNEKTALPKTTSNLVL